MAFKIVFIILSSVLLATNVAAKIYLVGDEKGWTFNFDYKEWARGKDFQVGDRLVFKYPAGMHNVFKVNGTSFQKCMVPPLSEALTSGFDVIVLSTPGRKWYICGVGQHCAIGGQKLAITVNSAWSPPSPSIAHPPSTWAPPSPSIAPPNPAWSPPTPSITLPPNLPPSIVPSPSIAPSYPPW